MKIVVAHLYYDLLNLYGECGNVRILKKVLEENGFDVYVKLLTVGDELNFNEYDFVYMGMGLKENLKIANEHLLEYKKDIEKYINHNKCILCTGNSYELFGKKIILDNDEFDCLGLFDFESKVLETRNINEITASSTLANKKIIGFVNCGSNNNIKENYFLDNINNTNDKEGININNFIGTYLIGPILVRNPELLKAIVSKIVLSKDSKYDVDKLEYDLELLEIAYDECLKRRKINE